MQAARMFGAHPSKFPSVAGLLPLAWTSTALHGMPKDVVGARLDVIDPRHAARRPGAHSYPLALGGSIHDDQIC